MATEEEVKLCRMSDSHINSCAGWYITTLAGLILLICTEKSGVVSLLYNNKCYTRLVPHLELHASLAYGSQLITQDL